MKRQIFYTLLPLLLLACADKRTTETVVVTKVVEEFREVSEVIEEESHTTESENQLTQFERITSEANKNIAIDYAPLFCELVNQKNLDNPFELEKHLSKNTRTNRFLPTLQSLNESGNCSSAKTIINLFPLQVFKIELGLDLNFYFILELNPNLKIRNLTVLYGAKLEVKKESVKMRDGKEITTILIQEMGSKKPFIITKTPYLNQGVIRYFNDYYQYQPLGFNIAIQSNRGSFYSTGDFRWLHIENIEDAQDTLEWLTKQETSNGKVLPIGVSYDGFNALTFAATNHPALIGTISCSSPASAQTDSLAGSEAPTFSYLDYINHRETSKEASLLYEKAAYLLKEDPSLFDNMDQELFGRKLQDWQDYVSSIKNGDRTYFDNRNLYPSLLKVKSPVFHVAGLTNDQDSRDMILTYQYLQSNLKGKEHPHYMYLHGGGHSCGSFLQSKNFQDLLSGDLSQTPKVMQYSFQTKQMTKISNYIGTFDTWESFPLELSVHSYFTDNSIIGEETATILADTLEGYSETGATSAQITFEKDMILNGSALVDLTLTPYAYGVNLIASAAIIDKWGNRKVVNNRAYAGSPYSYRLKKEDVAKTKTIQIMLPPDLKYISKGDTLVLSLSFYAPYVFDHLKEERAAFYKENFNLDFGLLYILKETPAKLHLPIEQVKELPE